MGNLFESNYKESKINNAETIFLISWIISGISMLIYLPILILIFRNKFSRLKIVQLQLLFSSFWQSFTYFTKPLNSQEYLCITKGPFNILAYLADIATSTVIVNVAYNSIHYPNNNKISCPFLFAVFGVGYGLPLVYFIIVIIFFEIVDKDYNHPCKLHQSWAVASFFVLCYICYIINIGYLVKSIIGMNKFIRDYPEEKVGVLFRRRLSKYLIWTSWNFLEFINKFILFELESHGFVFREFGIILLKYIIESTSGPLYVIIYCYTHNTMKEFFSLCKKKEHFDQTDDMISMEENKNSDVYDSINSEFCNDTIY